MTVFQNVAFGLTIKKLPKLELEKKVEEALGKLQIDQYSERYPSELSGEQQQRVAIATDNCYGAEDFIVRRTIVEFGCKIKS